MKLASVYALVSDLEFKAGMSLLKKEGYAGVELSNVPIIENPFSDGKARKLRDEEMPALCERAERYGEIVKNAGLEIIGFTPGCFTMCYFDDGFYENYYKVAAALGSPCIKLAGTIYRPATGVTYWDLLKESKRKLKVLSGYGEKYGVRSLVELHHGYLHESCSGAYNLLKDFDPRLVGVIHDPQNMVVDGKERWQMGFEILGSYLAYVHFKNSIFTEAEDGKWKWELSPIKDGLVDWEEVIDALKNTGFNGYLCNEYLGDKKNTAKTIYLRDEMNYIKSFLK